MNKVLSYVVVMDTSTKCGARWADAWCHGYNHKMHGKMGMWLSWMHKHTVQDKMGWWLLSWIQAQLQDKMGMWLLWIHKPTVQDKAGQEGYVVVMATQA